MITMEIELAEGNRVVKSAEGGGTTGEGQGGSESSLLRKGDPIANYCDNNKGLFTSNRRCRQARISNINLPVSTKTSNAIESLSLTVQFTNSPFTSTPPWLGVAMIT